MDNSKDLLRKLMEILPENTQISIVSYITDPQEEVNVGEEEITAKQDGFSSFENQLNKELFLIVHFDSETTLIVNHTGVFKDDNGSYNLRVNEGFWQVMRGNTLTNKVHNKEYVNIDDYMEIVYLTKDQYTKYTNAIKNSFINARTLKNGDN
jgi:16S rRNA C1402 (ribose-2'-O) methylase RsmI